MKNLKKILCIGLSLVMIMSVMCLGVSAAPLRKLDLVFVVDTTGSMSDDIYRVKTDMVNYLDDLDMSGMDYRIAIIDYRDFPERAASYDYEYKVQIDFTSDYEAIDYAINEISLGNGGDGPETVYSALVDGLNELSWRSEAGKAVILMGDAPALDPEPYTGYTLEMVKEALATGKISVDEWEGDYGLDAFVKPQADRSPITLFAVATDSYAESNFTELAEATGGKSYSAYSSDEVSEVITEIIDIIPEVVEDAELSFFEKVLQFFLNIFYTITFQFDLVDWSLCF